MRVERVNIVNTPGDPARVRLVADVSYRDQSPEEYWFEVDREFEDALSTLGNPWLAMLLPVAVTMGEPLEINAPVDPVLYEGAQHLMHIWNAWYPHLSVVPLEAQIMRLPTGVPQTRTAAFFSGGVDSFYSVLRHQGDGRPATGLYLDDLLFVWGADIDIRNRAAFTKARATLERAASELGKRLVPVSTNLRETRFWFKTNWPELSHGSAMGATALALENQYGTVVLASTIAYPRLRPWGSHALTDPLLSTSRLRIIHDGAFVGRLQKLEEVAHFDVALRHLRVCWRSEHGDNCGACRKCYRTMATLAILDALDKCTTFRAADFRLDRLARVYVPSRNIPALRDQESLALAMGKPEIARALRKSLRYSERLNAILPIVRRLKGKRLVWRIADSLESRLLSGSITNG